MVKTLFMIMYNLYKIFSIINISYHQPSGSRVVLVVYSVRTVGTTLVVRTVVVMG